MFTFLFPRSDLTATRVPVSPSQILIPVRVYVLVPQVRSDCYACSCFPKSDLDSYSCLRSCSPSQILLPCVFLYPMSYHIPMPVSVSPSHVLFLCVFLFLIPMPAPLSSGQIIFPCVFLFSPVISYSHACSCFPQLYHIPMRVPVSPSYIIFPYLVPASPSYIIFPCLFLFPQVISYSHT